jgi:hypothetical protein
MIIPDGTEVYVNLDHGTYRGIVLESRYHHAYRILYWIYFGPANQTDSDIFPEYEVSLAPPLDLVEPDFDLYDMELAEIIIEEQEPFNNPTGN